MILTGKYSHLNGFIDNGGKAFDGSQQTFPKLLQAAGYQTAIIGKWHLGQRPDRLRLLAHPAGPRGLLQPADDRERQAYAARRLHHRHHHRPLARLAEEARQEQAVPPDVPAQGAAPRVGARPGKYLNKYDDVTIPEPDTLFDDYAGRGKAATRKT